MVQVAVSRAHGQAVILADSRHSDQPGSEEVVACKSFQDDELLSVLEAKHGDVRPDDVQKFCHHRDDAVEVTFAIATAQPAGEFANGEPYRLALEISDRKSVV